MNMEKSLMCPSLQSSVAELLGRIDIPQRVLLSIFGFLAIINASSLRLCLDAVLKQISQPSNFTIIKQKPKLTPTCSLRWAEITKKYDHDFNRTSVSLWPKFFKFETTETDTYLKPFKEKFRRKGILKNVSGRDTYNWSSRTQTIIAASFYIGYIFSQIPGGLLAQKYGGKLVLAFSLMAAGILTLLTPLTIRYGGPIGLIILRILIGISEGPALPALSALLSRWIPPNERGKLGVFTLSGNQIGIVFVNIGSTIVLHLSQWPVIFYFFGGCALIWSMFFILFCSDEPASDPFITSEECQYLEESISNIDPITEITPIPWKQIFVNTPVWAMISSAIQYNWAEARTIASVSPILQIVEDQSLTADLCANLKASTPQLLSWIVSIVAGTICDILVEYGIASTTDVRRIMVALSAFGPRFFSDMSMCLTCDNHEDIFAKINCILGAMGSFYAGSKLTPLDLSPNYAGILMAISNCVGSIAAVVLPQIEALFPNSSIHRNLRSTLCFMSAILTSGDVQTFDSAAFASYHEIH